MQSSIAVKHAAQTAQTRGYTAALADEVSHICARLRSDRYLAGAAEKQTGHSFLDVSMAKDVWSNLCKDALMQIWLCSVRLELCLLLHSTCRALPRRMQKLAACRL